jgi:hypothetical protein
MTPQTDFMVVAPIRDGQIKAVRDFLMHHCAEGTPGHADRGNPAIAFDRIATLHNIRVAILDDPSLADRRVHPRDWPEESIALALIGVCDGEAKAIYTALVAVCGDWLRALFAHCEGFGVGDDTEMWMRAHSAGSAASYVNGPGRTVVQVHEEARLATLLRTERALLPPMDLQATADTLRRAIRGTGVTLTPDAPTPTGWMWRNALNLASVPIGVLVLLALLPKLWWLLIPAGALKLMWLRHLENTDPVVVVPTDPVDIEHRSSFEDFDTTNPFTAMGSLKPGFFRRWLTVGVLYITDWGARHLFRAGRLGRVGTIHFARWVLVDGGRRVVFTSEYDGQAEAYMDDFINKVGFGLNLTFSNGIGYPKTRWLILDGASDEQHFKYFMRHHQIITQFWWRAYPGMTTFDLARNARLRQGFETAMSDYDTERWLAEIG